MKRFGPMAFCWLACAGAFAQTSDLLVYEQLDSGFQFSYPRDWKMKKTREGVVFTVPIADTGRNAFVEAYGVTFTGDIPTWQAIQTATAKDQKREVVRQWQEEILTVPMLLGRTQWEARGVPTTADIAMIYAESPKMLVLRLQAATEDFPKADAIFRTMLQTLRTSTGRVPQPFDPTKPRQPENLVRRETDVKRWTVPRGTTAEATAPPVKGDQTAEGLAGTLPVLVRFSGAWKAQTDAGSLTFILAGINQDVKVTPFSALESLPPERGLVKASAVSLEPYTKVDVSSQKGWLTNKAGAKLALIERFGMAGTVPLRTLEAVVVTGDYYLVVSWRSVDAASAKMREKVMELIQTLSVEAKPS